MPVPSAPQPSPSESRKPRRARGGKPDIAPLRPLRTPRTVREHLQAELRTTGVGGLISLGLHLVVAFVLAMVMLRTPAVEIPPEILGGWLTPRRAPPPKQTAPREPIRIESIAIAATPVAKPAAKPKPAPPAPAPVVTRKPEEVDVQQTLAGRQPASREILVKRFGGNEQTEKAVSLGLAWLVRQQKSDGHWELHQGYPNAGSPSLKTSTGATSLAMLALLGAGHTHREGPFQQNLQKGLTWLRRVQKPNGDLHDSAELGRQTSFYAHGQATIVLCEAFAITRDPELQEPAQRALQFLYDSQHPVTGGWKYRPHSEGDLSVFGWQLMAIQSARMAGLDVPQEVLDRAALFLDQVAESHGARYRYEANPELPITLAMTAEGLLCRQFLGWQPEHPALRSGVEFLLQEKHLPRWSSGSRNVYAWYYATQVLHNVQGPAWDAWNQVLRSSLLDSQVKRGPQSGSWHPTQPAGAPQEYAAAGGRLYVTSMCVLMLEVYYRHLPLYAAPE